MSTENEPILTRPCFHLGTDVYSRAKGDEVDLCVLAFNTTGIARSPRWANILHPAYLVEAQLRGGLGSGFLCTQDGTFKINYAWRGLTTGGPYLLNGVFEDQLPEPFSTHTYTVRCVPAPLSFAGSYHESYRHLDKIQELGLCTDAANISCWEEHFSSRSVDISHEIRPYVTLFHQLLRLLRKCDYDISRTADILVQRVRSLPEKGNEFYHFRKLILENPVQFVSNYLEQYPMLQREHWDELVEHSKVELPAGFAI